MGGDAGGRERYGAAISPRGDTGHIYLCIDLKCFYASVECVERGLDPFAAHLVVADPTRGSTTICLAISPAMKNLGIRNRCRLFEIPTGVAYITAPPRMRRYMEVSAQIYAIYLRYVAPEDIHVYSIDECFVDATPYLALYGMTPREMAVMLMDAVYSETGICATAGIGTNLFLAKVALDVTAKHAEDRIGELDEAAFKRDVWTHEPITDIWNIGPGIARRLAKYGVHNLLGVAFMQEEVLYREFGVNAELLIDHAWGREPCTIRQIHEYEPAARSICNGQVLFEDYSYEEALVVLKEMVDASVLDLVEKDVVTDRISLSVGYARQAEDAPPCPPPASARDRSWGMRTGGSRKLPERTNSYRKLLPHFESLFAETTRRDRPIRRLSIGFENLLGEEFATAGLFDDLEADERERHVQQAVLAIKGKFGKNALIKGMSMADKATARERNTLIGGHRAGAPGDLAPAEGPSPRADAPRTLEGGARWADTGR